MNDPYYDARNTRASLRAEAKRLRDEVAEDLRATGYVEKSWPKPKQAMAGFLFALLLAALVWLCCGCTHAVPRAVLDADLMVRDAHATVERNTLTTVDALQDELLNVAAQGNAAMLAERQRALVRPDGTVDAKAYDALASQAARAQTQAAAGFDAQIAPLRQTLADQFAAERRLLDALAAYHRAAGLSDTTRQMLLGTVSDASKAVASFKAPAPPRPAVDWAGIASLAIKAGGVLLPATP